MNVKMPRRAVHNASESVQAGAPRAYLRPMRRLAPLLALTFAAALLTTPAANAAVTVTCSDASQPCGTPCAPGDASCWQATTITCPTDGHLERTAVLAIAKTVRQQREIAGLQSTITQRDKLLAKREARIRHQARLIRRLRHRLAAS